MWLWFRRFFMFRRGSVSMWFFRFLRRMRMRMLGFRRGRFSLLRWRRDFSA
jgi:hypothetical protein